MYNEEEEEEIPVLGRPNQAHNFMEDDAADELLAKVIHTDLPYPDEQNLATNNNKVDAIRSQIIDLLEEAKTRIHDPNWLTKYEKIKNKI
jgi:hypothetical protein